MVSLLWFAWFLASPSAFHIACSFILWTNHQHELCSFPTQNLFAPAMALRRLPTLGAAALAMKIAVLPKARKQKHQVTSTPPPLGFAPAIACAPLELPGWWPFGTSDQRLIEEALSNGTVDTELRLHVIKLLFKDPSRANTMVLKSAVLFFLVAAGPIAGLKLLGFKASGVAAVSVAASIQAKFPLVSAGSWFAWAQGVGAKAGVLGTGAMFSKAGLGASSSYVLYRMQGDRDLLESALKAGVVDDEMRRLLQRPAPAPASKLWWR